MTTRHRVFARMWGVAALAHLAGNWRHGDVWPDPTPIGFLFVAIGLVGTAVVILPRRRFLLVLSALVAVAVVLEAPVLGNHWLLAGFVSLAYLLTGGSWERFEVAARVILVVFYAFAAFAKLNTGFLDPVTSCGLFFANQWLDGFGISTISSTGTLAWATAWGTAIVELAIPLLLVIRRLRPGGVSLAIGFHGIISLDLGQHFYDFTAVLLPLFVLFLPDSYSDRFERLSQSIRPRFRKSLAGTVAVAAAGLTLASVTPLSSGSAWWLIWGSFLWWVPYLGVVVWAVAGALRQVTLDWRLGPVAMLLGALVFLNGLTPYLELKTGYGWNMYSNLVTVNGESNHLIVSQTVPLREGHSGLVTILASSDPGLEIYAHEGFLLPWPSFRAYLSVRPQISVSYQRHGVSVDVPRVGNSHLASPVPWWWRWMPLRSVRQDTPAACQPAFLPAL